MDCVMKDVVGLDKSGICPFSGQKCDGTMSISWGTDKVLIPGEKVCLSQLHVDGQPALVEITTSDLDRIRNGEVLMFKTPKGCPCFVKVSE